MCCIWLQFVYAYKPSCTTDHASLCNLISWLHYCISLEFKDREPEKTLWIPMHDVYDN